jgi:hypothetical protein
MLSMAIREGHRIADVLLTEYQKSRLVPARAKPKSRLASDDGEYAKAPVEMTLRLGPRQIFPPEGELASRKGPSHLSIGEVAIEQLVKKHQARPKHTRCAQKDD